MEPAVRPDRLSRLAQELEDEGVPALDDVPDPDATLEELAYALRPRVHERRVPTYGAVVVPSGTARQWAEDTSIPVQLLPVDDLDPELVRMLADGMATFALRCPGEVTHLVCFDRMMTDEYALVALQEAAGGVLVQRHPAGQVRVFGPSGLVRWDGITWYHEPPVAAWIDALAEVGPQFRPEALRTLLRFAVYELSARHIGATLICRPDQMPLLEGAWERRLPAPPPLSLATRGGTAALRHVLAQIDGATVLSPTGDLRELGIRLIPSLEAERSVAPLRGTRHTAAIRYSYDDPEAVVVVVSEDGPVTVLHRGRSVASATERVCEPVAPAG